MFSILFVCSGNQHRSPSAEAFVRHLAADKPVEVASVGTLGIEGAPAAPEVVAFCSSVGANASTHRSRGLAAGEARLADLVCGFELAHVGEAFGIVDAWRGAIDDLAACVPGRAGAPLLAGPCCSRSSEAASQEERHGPRHVRDRRARRVPNRPGRRSPRCFSTTVPMVPWRRATASS